MKDITNEKVGMLWKRYVNNALKDYKKPVTAAEVETWRANFYAGAYATITLVFAPFNEEPGSIPAETILQWLIELKVELELEIIEAAAEAANADPAAQQQAAKAAAARRAILIAINSSRANPQSN